jgi:hypothetical protein
MLPYLQEDPSVARARPDFFVVYVNAAQRGQIPPAAQAAIDAGPPELTAVVHGQAYAWVYRATSER